MRHQRRGALLRRLDGVGAEVFVEPRAPGDLDLVAGLQQRRHPLAATAAHQAEVAPVGARHHLEDEARLAVPAPADDEALVAPFHAERHSTVPAIPS